MNKEGLACVNCQTKLETSATEKNFNFWIMTLIISILTIIRLKVFPEFSLLILIFIGILLTLGANMLLSILFPLEKVDDGNTPNPLLHK